MPIYIGGIPPAGGTVSGSLIITGNLTVNGNFTFGDAVTDVLTVTGIIKNSNGTAAAPSYTFTSDPDTGFYSITGNQIGVALNGALVHGFYPTYFGTAQVLSLGATTLTLKGQVADGASAVGATIGSYNTLSTAGSKIASFVNNTTEKAYITKDGTFGSVLGAVTLGSGATTFAAAGNVMTITGDAGGNTIATITTGVTGQTLVLRFVDALVTITNDDTGTANTIDLSAAFTSSARDTLSLIFNGTSWQEIARSVN